MIGDRGPAYRKGRAIRARDLNRATRMAESLARTRTGGAQLQLDGIPLGRAVPAGEAHVLGKTNGTIAARSDLTMGETAGNVSLYDVHPDGTIADSGRDLDAYNWTGGTIASGKYCLLARVGGLYLITSAEC